MKLQGGWLTGNAPPNARGRVVIRNTRWGTIAQAWPRKRSKRWSPSQYWWYRQFAIAAYMSSTALSIDLQTATEMAKGTQQVPRDILMMCAYGTYYQVTLSDGTTLSPSKKTAPDEFTTVEALQMIDASLWEDWNSTTYSTSAFCFKGVTITTLTNIQLSQVTTRWNVNLLYTYKLIIAAIDETGVIQSIQVSSVFSPMLGGSQNVAIQAETVLMAGQRYAIMIGRTDGPANYALPIAFPQKTLWHGPITAGNWARIASTNPKVGDTIDTTGTGAIPMALY